MAKCADCGDKCANYGLPSDGKRKWCGGCSKRRHPGAELIGGYKCEDCRAKTASFGLPGAPRRRWCAGCARRHTGAHSLHPGQTNGKPARPAKRPDTQKAVARCEGWATGAGPKAKGQSRQAAWKSAAISSSVEWWPAVAVDPLPCGLPSLLHLGWANPAAEPGSEFATLVAGHAWIQPVPPATTCCPRPAVEPAAAVGGVVVGLGCVCTGLAVEYAFQTPSPVGYAPGELEFSWYTGVVLGRSRGTPSSAGWWNVRFDDGDKLDVRMLHANRGVAWRPATVAT